MALVGPNGATVKLRYREERTREGDDPKEHERVEASYDVFAAWLTPDDMSQVQIEQGDEGKWRQLLYTYCHDSYDGEYQLILEDGFGEQGLADKVLEVLGSSTSPDELFQALGEHSTYPEGFRLISG